MYQRVSTNIFLWIKHGTHRRFEQLRIDGSTARRCIAIVTNSSSTMRFIHINEYEYMNNYAQYIILHTRIRIRFMHGFSSERQPLHCDVIVGKQIIFN